MKRLIITALVLALIPVGAWADESQPPQQKTPQEQPKTKYETFTSADGVLLVTEDWDLPAVSPVEGFTLAYLVRATEMSSKKSAIAMRITHGTANRYLSPQTAVLDEDEITSAVAALNYILDHQQEIRDKATTSTEVKYRSRGGFGFGFYYNPQTKAGGQYMIVRGAIVKIHSLDDLRKSTVAGMEKVKQLNPQ